MSDLHFFDRNEEYTVVERHLPHWAQAGTITFLTYRTADSIPAPVRDRWIDERNQILCRFGLDPTDDWKFAIKQLPRMIQDRLRWSLTSRFDEFLDECHGDCVLRRAELSQIVVENLHFSDGKRYHLTDFVVMPNHVHILAAFHTNEEMLQCVESWKRYQARRINTVLQRTGHFWQSDGFDHLVRSEPQFMHYRRYIANNPAQAGLKAGEYRHYSRV